MSYDPRPYFTIVGRQKTVVIDYDTAPTFEEAMKIAERFKALGYLDNIVIKKVELFYEWTK